MAIYLIYAIIMVFAHPQVIYPFGDDAFENPAFRPLTITDRDVVLAVHEGTDDVAVLYFMGNGGALAYFGSSLNAHVAAGRHVVAMAYPGGGGIPGKPSELGLKRDALAAYDWLAADFSGDIVVHGYSMGTGLAQHVAAERDVAAIILDAPFVKMCELMTRAAWLPACYMPGVQRWDSAALVPRIAAPVLVQHGTADDLIPMRDGLRLAALMQDAGLDATFHAVEGAGHNDLARQPRYQGQINAFLGRVLE
ncbi:alpha/beta hydrolase [Yoonia sp. BS5-3]|uniref:Alpha/beta hydrolase n=1 Tax=Yoonia phaeophyticola TaxID=3137369 RepID=A0ABZ2V1E6_9RHOB